MGRVAANGGAAFRISVAGSLGHGGAKGGSRGEHELISANRPAAKSLTSRCSSG